MDKYDIFISYCRVDNVIAQQIHKRLKELGHTCFLDALNLNIGDDYANTIQSKIINSKYVIFVYGDKSEDSIYQRRELDLTLESGKRVLSLFITPCKDGVIHSILTKKTICCTAIDNLLNNIQKEISNKHGEDKTTILPNTDKIWTRYHKSQKKKWYILLAITLLFVIYLLLPSYYTCSPPLVEEPCESSPPLIENSCDSIPIEQSENINDSNFVSETLDSDTLNLSFNENKNNHRIINKITTSQQLNVAIWTNMFISALAGLLVGIILMFIVKICRKKKNIKLSSDVNVSVSIDGHSVARINAGDVYTTHLEKGEYLIDFQSNDKKEEHNRIIQKIIDNDTHVIFSEFLNKKEIKFKCFIAGSLALNIERNALIAVVSKMHNRWENERFRISSYTFEDFNRDVVPGGQQKLYDTFIENDADWCVFIISNGIGEKTLNEYRVAMNSLHKNGHPKILFLASSEPTKDETLSAIKKEIIDANQYWNSCNNIEHMQSIFRDCIEWDVTLLSKSKR